MAATWLSDAKKAELAACAKAMSSPGKGFLASDESAGPWLRAGHVEAKKIPDTPENRAAYRSMLYKTPGLSQYISGVILHWETLFQSDADGNKMVDLITKAGMIPGIKLDKVWRVDVCGCGGDRVCSVLCCVCVCFRPLPRRLCLECGLHCIDFPRLSLSFPLLVNLPVDLMP